MFHVYISIVRSSIGLATLATLANQVKFKLKYTYSGDCTVDAANCGEVQSSGKFVSTYDGNLQSFVLPRFLN